MSGSINQEVITDNLTTVSNPQNYGISQYYNIEFLVLSLAVNRLRKFITNLMPFIDSYKQTDLERKGVAYLHN